MLKDMDAADAHRIVELIVVIACRRHRILFFPLRPSRLRLSLAPVRRKVLRSLWSPASECSLRRAVFATMVDKNMAHRPSRISAPKSRKRSRPRPARQPHQLFAKARDMGRDMRIGTGDGLIDLGGVAAHKVQRRA